MSWTQDRARIAAHKRNHPDAEVPAELYRDLRASRAEAYIADLIAAAPPLSKSQRSRLAALLAPTGGGRT